MSIQILIVDDHGILRAGLRTLLNAEPDLRVIGEAANGADGLSLAIRLQPDVVLMDISLPDIDGIEVTRRLSAQYPKMRVLLLTIHEDKELLREGMRAGAAGYIVKRAVESELINAIRSVARGDLYIHPAMTRALLENQAPLRASPQPANTLTAREIDVLRLIARGYTNRQTAEALNVSVRTVETHRANLMAKLKISSRVELVRYAADHGLLKDKS